LDKLGLMMKVHYYIKVLKSLVILNSKNLIEGMILEQIFGVLAVL